MPIGGSSGGLSSAGPGAGGGAQGPQGATGSQGPQGHQGFQGNQGTQGSGGAQGTQGAQGNTGAQGPQGGSAQVNSYMVTSGAANVLVGTTGPLVFDSPADLLVGTDLSISMDGKTITFATTGWYMIEFGLNARPSTGADSATAIASLSATSADPNNLVAEAGAVAGGLITPNTTTDDYPLAGFAIGPSKFLAGDHFEIMEQGAVIAGTPSIGSFTLAVIRTA